MKTSTICFTIILTCSCHTTDDTHPVNTRHTMTWYDAVRKIMRDDWIHEYETVDDTYWSSGAVRRKVLSELRKMKKDYYYESSDPNIPLIPGPGWTIRGPLTIAQIEQESLREMREYPDVPQVPFGYENDSWNNFKSQYKDGDEFYFFAANVQNLVYPHGTAGYVLISDNQVVGSYVTVSP